MGHAGSRKDDVAVSMAAQEDEHRFIVKEDGSPDEEGEAFIKEHLPFDGAFVIDGQKRGRIHATKVLLKTCGSALEQDVQGGTGYTTALMFSRDVQDCVVIKASEDSTGAVFVCFRGRKQHYMFPSLRAPKGPLYAGDVPQRNGHFQGRIKELKEIEQRLLKNEKQGCNATVLIAGLGGIGKTQTAKEFLHRMSEKRASADAYDVLMWLDGAGDLEVQYRRIAEQMTNFRDKGQTDEPGFSLSFRLVMECIGQFLSKQKRWLLILDNVENRRELEAFIPTTRGTVKGHILMTARERIGLFQEVVELKCLEEEDARVLLRKLLPPMQTGKLGCMQLECCSGSFYSSS
uniref:DAC domain-containing protein n=1 Tax=Chromera velia CCMP2878 TaxID=1169474 RepID=A0A0G4GH58_9ALVE|eukprot:Cvel_21874.t1-p1 / transcript=Cvel_21874.t1 / gene=Cvel_21874 / organism=Chromera_velia_CCMP2878 / gene_product=hypothetical protein / transcript_product=hypothetical protein / location=Cvel_scaffold2091:7284-8318(-) / protein_length=345 / sequence_SO=supercontig / SO=protein_coding / is_pseudo=false